MWEIGSLLRPVAKREGAAFLVNDRLDLALGLGADGAHLAGRSVAVADARVLLGPTALIGCSVHRREDAGRAVGEAAASAAGARFSRVADFVIAGAIFPTPTHPTEAARGVDVVAEVRDALPSMPVVGIGGVDASRAPEVMARGAHGIAVVRAVWDARDAGAAVGDLLRVLGQARDTRAEALIDVVVNGTPRKAPAGSTIKDLIESVGLVPAMVVVERNLEILERGAYGTVVLAPGDRLELVHFVGGG
jgi:thiamine-phosphate pyrophosphorylase